MVATPYVFCMDALTHILLSLVALFGAGAGLPVQQDATTANPEGVPFAISDDAAQRAFPYELGCGTRDRDLGRAPVRRLGGDRAAAPGAAARPARPGLRLVRARRRRRPLRPCRPGRAARVLARAGVGQRRRGPERVAARTPRISATSRTQPLAAIRKCACSTTGTSPTCGCSLIPTPSRPTSRSRARSMPACTRPTRAARVVAGNLARYRDAGRDPAAWAARLHADGVPMDFFGIHPYPLRRAPLAVRDPGHRIDLLDVPALARLAGVPGRSSRSSAGRPTTRAANTRPSGPHRRSSSLAARPGSPASSSGASTITRCRSA